MIDVLVDLGILGIFIIGITATIGVVSSSIGLKLFSGGKANLHLNQSDKTQNGWKSIGGR